jgi:hypothetical protein
MDGEVAEFRLLPVAEALARAAAGELTTDAALATLDFALRRGLVGPAADGVRAGGGADAAPAIGAERLRAFERLKAPVLPSTSGNLAPLPPFKATEARRQ